MSVKKKHAILLIAMLCSSLAFPKVEAGALKLPWVCECMTEQGKFEIRKFKSFKDIQTANQSLVINFGSTKCKECKEYKDLARDLYKTLFGWVKIKYVNTDTNETALESLPIHEKNFQVFFHSTGNPFVPSKELQETIDFIIYRDPQSQKHLYTFHKGLLTETQLQNILKELY